MKKIITADTYISLQIDCFLRFAKDSLDRKSKEPDFDICKKFVDKFLELNNAEVFEYEDNKEVAQKELREKEERIKLLEKYLVILDRNSRSNYISKQEGELVKLIRVEIKQIGEMK